MTRKTMKDGGQVNDGGGVEEWEERSKQDVQYLFWKIRMTLSLVGFLGKQGAS